MAIGTLDPAGYVGSGTLEFFQNDISLLTAIAKNRWKIDVVTKQLTFYEEDELTALMVFDLKDDLGVANAKKIFERIPLCADVTPPAVTGRTPGPGSTTPVSTVLVTFSEPVENVTVDSFMVLRPQLSILDNFVLGSVTRPTPTTALFTPAAPFASFEIFEVVLTSAIQDLCGNKLTRTAWSWQQGTILTDGPPTAGPTVIDGDSEDFL